MNAGAGWRPVVATTDKNASFRSLGDAPADTTAPAQWPHAACAGDLAEFEREIIGVCAAERRSRAKANGVKLGREPKLTAHQRQEAIRRRDAGEPVGEMTHSYDVHGSTTSRLGTWSNEYCCAYPIWRGIVPPHHGRLGACQ